MPIPTVVGVGVEATGTTGAVTYPWPVGPSVLADDIGILLCETNLTGGLTAPTGWAHVTNSPRAQGANVTSVNVFWRRCTGGDAAPQVPASTDHQIGCTLLVRGVVNAGNPWDFAPVGSGNASGSNMSATGGTTTVADCLVIVCSANQTDTGTDNYTSVTNGTLANFTVQNIASTLNGNGGGIMLATGELASPGATGTTTATITVAGATSNLVLALVGATAAAPAIPPILVMARNLGG